MEERVEELLEVAHMYQLAGLVDTCRETILQQITEDNALHTLATLHRFPVDGEDQQKKDAIRFVQKNHHWIEGTKKCETFASTFPDLVEEVLGGIRLVQEERKRKREEREGLERRVMRRWVKLRKEDDEISDIEDSEDDTFIKVARKVLARIGSSRSENDDKDTKDETEQDTESTTQNPADGRRGAGM